MTRIIADESLTLEATKPISDALIMKLYSNESPDKSLPAISFPSKSIVVDAIKIMDGATKNEVSLQKEDGSNLLIVGGYKNRFTCEITLGDQYPMMVLPSLTKSQTVLKIIEYEDPVYPEHVIVGLDLAIDVACYFLEQGCENPSLIWSSDW